MTTETTTGRPVKYAALEWRNKQGEKFDSYREDSLCYLKEDENPYTGKAIELYENGNPSLQGEFHEGRAHGEEVWWYENGNKNSLVTFRHGDRHGPHLVWYEEGQLQIDVCYTEGKRDGRHAVYYEGGQIRSEAYFVNDNLDGSYTTWFEDGSKRSERTFKAGEELKRMEWNQKGEQKKLNNWKADGTPRN